MLSDTALISFHGELEKIASKEETEAGRRRRNRRYLHAALGGGAGVASGYAGHRYAYPGDS